MKVIKVQQARESSSEGPIKPKESSKWNWRVSKMKNAFRKSIHQLFKKKRLLEKFYIRSRSKRLPKMIRRTRLRLAIVRTPGASSSIVNASKTTDIVVVIVGAVAATIVRIMKKWDLRQKNKFLFETLLHSGRSSPSKLKNKTPRTFSAPTHWLSRKSFSSSCLICNQRAKKLTSLDAKVIIKGATAGNLDARKSTASVSNKESSAQIYASVTAAKTARLKSTST